MSASDVSDTLDDALAFTELNQVKVQHRPTAKKPLWSATIKQPDELNHLLNQAANGPTIFDDIHNWCWRDTIIDGAVNDSELPTIEESLEVYFKVIGIGRQKLFFTTAQRYIGYLIECLGNCLKVQKALYARRRALQ